MNTQFVSNLEINKLSKEQYKRELALGNINETSLYLTPDTTEEELDQLRTDTEEALSELRAEIADIQASVEDTGATDVVITGTGNAVTNASYDAATREITLTKGETFAKAADLNNYVSAAELETEITYRGNADDALGKRIDSAEDRIEAVESSCSGSESAISNIQNDITDLKSATTPAQPSTSNAVGKDGLMSAADKAKLDGIDVGANRYELSAATSLRLGGVKSGGDITIDNTGLVTVNDNSHAHTIDNITNLQTTLNTFMTETDVDNKLSPYESDIVALQEKTELAAPATSDGTGGKSGLMSASDKAKLDNIATGANKYVLPTASTAALGGIKSGGDISIDSTGLVSVKDNSHSHTSANISDLQAKLDAKVNTAAIGVANGIASLGSDGKVPASQLPSYVDDVLEYTKKSSFPTSGETGKIYIAQDTNITYRWSGSAYVEISASLALGETSSTAYAGNKGAALATQVSGHATSISELTTKVNAVQQQSDKNKEDIATNVSEITALNDAVYPHIEASSSHVSAGDRTNWNAAYTHSTTAHAPSTAQANVLESVKLNGSALTIANKAVDIPVASANNAGIMSAQMATNLSSHGSSISDLNTKYNSLKQAVDKNAEDIATNVSEITTVSGTVNNHVDDTDIHITATERTNWGKGYTHSATPHAPSNAEANVITSIKLANTAATITNKSVNIPLATNAQPGLLSAAQFNKVELIDSMREAIDGNTAEINNKADTSHNHDGTYAPASHTHNYAGSSSAGGSATSAVKLDTTTAGSTSQPVYFKDGKPSAISYTISKSVPSTAVFTDTLNTTGVDDYQNATLYLVGATTKGANNSNTSARTYTNANIYANGGTLYVGENNPVLTAAEIGSEVAEYMHSHSVSDISDFPTSITPKAHTHKKSDITDFPTIPTVNNGTLTIQKNGSTVATFTANQSSAATANITVPTKVSELTNDSGFLTSSSTVSASKVDSTSYGNLETWMSDTETAIGKCLTDIGTVFSSDIHMNGNLSKYGADISMNEWVGFVEADINDKVSKVSGKGLSTNDYTTAEKNKLAGIATGATANTGTITGVSANGTSIATSGVANIPAASTGTYGVTKLSSSTSSTSEDLAATPKAVKAAYDKGNHSHPYLSDSTKYAGSATTGGPATNVAVTRATSSVLTIAANQPVDTEAIWFGGSDGVTISAMPETYCICNIKKGNNHRTLIDCYSLVNGKHWINGNQDTRTGSWTGWKLQPGDADKTKLDGIESGAKKNVQSDWNVTDTSSDAYIKNKPTIPTVNNGTLTIQKNGTNIATFSANQSSAATANITVPTKVSDLTNDSGFLTSSSTLSGSNVSCGEYGNLVTWMSATESAFNNVAPTTHTHESSQISLTPDISELGADSSLDQWIDHIEDELDTHTHGASEISGLATVAKTGSYNDLNNKPTSLKNPTALTFGSKTYDGSAAKEITAADLGLSGAMKFLGTSSTAISDGSTTKTITVNSSSVTVSAGNVVLYSGSEYVWDGAKWEELGHEGSFKVKQTAVASPSASGSTTAFIDTISQDANGNITVTKKNVSFPVSSVAGKTGAVTLAKADVGLGNVDNTADANKSVKYATSAGSATTATSCTGNAASATTLTGLTATITELNYVDGVTSNIQTQLNNKLSLNSEIESDNVMVPADTTGFDSLDAQSVTAHLSWLNSRINDLQTELYQMKQALNAAYNSSTNTTTIS